MTELERGPAFCTWQGAEQELWQQAGSLKAETEGTAWGGQGSEEAPDVTLGVKWRADQR